MGKNKIIIIALIVIVLALAIGMFLMVNNDKEDTRLTVMGNSTLDEGDSIDVMLTDLNGVPLDNQTINVTIIDDLESCDYKKLVTDSKGIAKLKLNKSAGNYTINCTYGGNEKYAGSASSKEITIIQEVIEQTVTSYEPTSYSSQQSSEPYRPAVDSGGITREVADEYGYEYTSEHGGHYIGPMDHWDENAGMYHD